MIESILIILGLVVGSFVFGVLLSSVLIWLAAKALNFLEQGFGTALKTAIVYTVFVLILSGSVLAISLISIGLISTILSLLLVPVYFLLLLVLIRNFYSVDWVKAFLASLIVYIIEAILIAIVAGIFFMVFGVVLWQLGIFNAGHGVGGPTYGEHIPVITTSGWIALQPLSPSISYDSSGQKVTVSFANAVGTKINITGIKVNEKLSDSSGVSCTASVGGVPDSQLSTRNVVVPPGSMFTIDATCTGADRKRSDPYELSITIQYTSVIGGKATTHSESGTIRGVVE